MCPTASGNLAPLGPHVERSFALLINGGVADRVATRRCNDLRAEQIACIQRFGRLVVYRWQIDVQLCQGASRAQVLYVRVYECM